MYQFGLWSKECTSIDEPTRFTRMIGARLYIGHHGALETWWNTSERKPDKSHFHDSENHKFISIHCLAVILHHKLKINIFNQRFCINHDHMIQNADKANIKLRKPPLYDTGALGHTVRLRLTWWKWIRWFCLKWFIVTILYNYITIVYNKKKTSETEMNPVETGNNSDPPKVRFIKVLKNKCYLSSSYIYYFILIVNIHLLKFVSIHS